jgi:glyoxylase-like metal-dependent hydrolase (beta-lactamase superfamily II)
LAACVTVRSQEASTAQIKVIPVAGSVYMLEGEGGNIGVSAGEDGIVVVDDEFAPLAPKIQAALKGITDKPIRAIINTHWHFDHVGGNAYFQRQAPIIAHDDVRKRLERGGLLLGRQVPPAEKDALPMITFNDRVTLHMNGEEIRVIHLPDGHTDGDSVVVFTKSNVVHMGDDFVTYGFPFIDLDNGGSVAGMISAVEKIIATVPPDIRVIPGHGPISTIADLKTFVTMLKETSARVQAGIKQGKTLEALKKERTLADYEKYTGRFISSDKFLELLYTDLTRKRP